MKKENALSTQLGLTHLEMAMLLGISRSLYTLYLQGKRQLPTNALLKLSELQLQLPADSAKTAKPKVEQRTLDAFKKLLGDNGHALYMLERKIAATEKKLRAEANLQHFSTVLADRKHSKSAGFAVDLIASKASAATQGIVSSELALLQHRKEVLEFEKKLLESKLKQ